MRVSIARALVTRPKLLLMDQPVAALDEITRQKLNDDVLRLGRDSGVTVIFVTHSVFESAFLSRRMVVMKAGPGDVVGDVEITPQNLIDDVLRLWRDSGLTVIFVTDSVFESAFLSRRIVVMRARPGQVFADLQITTSAARDGDYRTSEEYRATTHDVSRALQ